MMAWPRASLKLKNTEEKRRQNQSKRLRSSHQCGRSSAKRKISKARRGKSFQEQSRERERALKIQNHSKNTTALESRNHLNPGERSFGEMTEMTEPDCKGQGKEWGEPGIRLKGPHLRRAGKQLSTLPSLCNFSGLRVRPWRNQMELSLNGAVLLLGIPQKGSFLKRNACFWEVRQSQVVFVWLSKNFPLFPL